MPQALRAASRTPSAAALPVLIMQGIAEKAGGNSLHMAVGTSRDKGWELAGFEVEHA